MSNVAFVSHGWPHKLLLCRHQIKDDQRVVVFVNVLCRLELWQVVVLPGSVCFLFQVEVYAVVDGHLFLIGPAELRHLRWMMHMADQEVRGGQISMAFCAFCYHFHTHHMPCSVSNKLQEETMPAIDSADVLDCISRGRNSSARFKMLDCISLASMQRSRPTLVLRSSLCEVQGALQFRS